MAPPPLKKTKSSSSDVTETVLGSITNRDSLVESDSELDSDSNDETKSGSSGSDSGDSGEVIILNAPPSPPPTISKRKRGRKPKEVEALGSCLLFFR
jgi:hypothetical protein